MYATKYVINPVMAAVVVTDQTTCNVMAKVLKLLIAMNGLGFNIHIHEPWFIRRVDHKGFSLRVYNTESIHVE